MFFFFFFTKEVEGLAMELALFLLFIFVVVIVQERINLRKYKGKFDKDNHHRNLTSPTFTEPTYINLPVVKDSTHTNEANQFCRREEKQAHLRSKYWSNLKQQRLALARHTCEVPGCTHTTQLHLHHVDYYSLLAEDIDDVVIVCGDRWVNGELIKGHHQQIHDAANLIYTNGYGRENLYPISLIIE